MSDEHQPPLSFALTAALFEGGLAIMAVALGRFVDIDPLATFAWSGRDLGWGLVAVLPPLGLLALCLVVPWRPIRQLRRVIDRLLLPLFRDLNWLDLAVISLLAGLGEEMLFRGVIQAGMAAWIAGPTGVAVGLIAASALFGMAHAITPAYLVLAGAIGFYLGAIWLLTGNLLVAITTHAVYDLLAMVYLAKFRLPPPDDAAAEDLPPNAD